MNPVLGLRWAGPWSTFPGRHGGDPEAPRTVGTERRKPSREEFPRYGCPEDRETEALGGSGDRTGISRDRRAACRPADLRIRTSLETGRAITGSQRSSDRGLPVSARRGLRPSTTSERSWVPGPTPIGTRAPRGLRLRPMLPRGLLVVGITNPLLRGPSATLDL